MDDEARQMATVAKTSAPEHVEKRRAQNEMVFTAVVKELRLEALKATVQLLEKETLETPIDLKSVPLDVTWLPIPETHVYHGEKPVKQSLWMLDMSTRIDELGNWLQTWYTADQAIRKYETTQKALENRHVMAAAAELSAVLAAIESSYEGKLESQDAATRNIEYLASRESHKAACKGREETRACEAAKEMRADFEAFEAARGMRVERNDLEATREMREIQESRCACESQHASDSHCDPTGAITAPESRDLAKEHERKKKTPGCALKVLFLVVAALFASLLVTYTASLAPRPDHLLQSTFQPNHDIADMMNWTRPDLGDLRRLMFYSSYQGYTVGSLMGEKGIPGKEAIAKDMEDAAKAMKHTALQIMVFVDETRRMVLLNLKPPYRYILNDLRSKSKLPWYDIEALKLPSYTRLRQEWLSAARNSRGPITKLAALADRHIRELSGISDALSNIEQRMAQIQQGHIEENAKSKSKWVYRLKILPEPIPKDTCEDLIVFVESYHGAVDEVIKGLTARRDALLAAAKSLDLPPTTCDDNHIFGNRYGFEEPYQTRANEMVRHLTQAAKGL
ncbi:hypothetical protein PG999_012262 [Apiospora kogelbergensis]|uniref:Uncharacterized protein n=1 Tax=Apiospora kogelbergensis TaxID=1337665 RepID=A0AAW0QL01_9PEZI